MARTSLGKEFESKFKTDWLRTFPKSLIYRLPDQMSRLTGSTNPCDFICYSYPVAFMVECKETEEGTLKWSAFPQYARLLKYKDIHGLVPGVLIWYSSFDEIRFVSIEVCEQMHIDGKKSVSLKDLQKNKYQSLLIESEKLQKFMRSDYTELFNFYKEQMEV